MFSSINEIFESGVEKGIYFYEILNVPPSNAYINPYRSYGTYKILLNINKHVYKIPK